MAGPSMCNRHLIAHSQKHTLSGPLQKKFADPWFERCNRLREQTYGCQGKDGGRIVRELGMDRYTLVYFKWIANKDLLYST